MAKKSKKNRIQVILECTEYKKLGVPPSRYVTYKNKINSPKRLELMKYNWYARKHTLHREVK